MKTSLPQSVKATLWSYDTSQMDIDKHAKRIILQVLNWGTTDAVQWLHNTYDQKTLQKTVTNSLMGDWNKKSLALWSLHYGQTQRTSRI